MFCKSTPLVLRNSIQEKDNAEKSPFTKLYLLLTNRELSVKGLFFLLKVFFQQIILLSECCDILVDQSFQCSFDIHIYNRLNSFIE